VPDLNELLSWLIPFIHDWITAGGGLDYPMFVEHAYNFVGDASEPDEWHNFRSEVSDADRVIFLTSWVARLENG